MEIQVLSNAAAARHHLVNLQPDTFVLDADSLDDTPLFEFLDDAALRRVPTVVLGSRVRGATAVRKADALAAGAANFVSRREGYVRRLGDAVRRQQRLSSNDVRLLETEKHYQEILEATSDGIVALVDGVIRYANRSFCDAVGYTADNLIGLGHFSELTAEAQRKVVQKAIAHMDVNNTENELMKVGMLSAAGESLYFEISWRSSIFRGQRALVGVARDMTGAYAMQRQAERGRQKAAHAERLRMLGKLSAGVAHDFNNAIGAIIGRLSMAGEKLAHGKSPADDLRVAMNAARNAANVVQRIQEFSKPRGHEVWEDVNLAQVVEEVVEFIDNDIPVGVTLSTELRSQPHIRGNAAELREVLLNLLRNALDAVGDNGAVTVSCCEEDERAVLLVEDDGAGMPEEVQRQIFEPFFSTKENRGTGLGLSVSRWILRRHDAQLELESAPGEGTQFRLAFALNREARRVPKSPAAGELAVVVVEDDSTVAETVSDLLREQGHRVRVVSRASEVAEHLDTLDCDLLITDLDLPEMSGWELARRVRRQLPTTFIGLMTGWPLDLSGEELQARGVDYVLSKPFSMDSFQRMLDEAQKGNGE